MADHHVRFWYIKRLAVRHCSASEPACHFHWPINVVGNEYSAHPLRREILGNLCAKEQPARLLGVDWQ